MSLDYRAAEPITVAWSGSYALAAFLAALDTFVSWIAKLLVLLKKIQRIHASLTN